jgi:hypothetical protein
MRSLMFSGYTSAQAGGCANKGRKPSRPSRVLSSGGIWVSRRLESWPAIFKVPTRIACNWRSSRWTSPFSLCMLAGTLAQRYLGIFGFYAVSITGGLLSSASAVAAAGTEKFRKLLRCSDTQSLPLPSPVSIGTKRLKVGARNTGEPRASCLQVSPTT